MSYKPTPGTIPHRVIEHLKTLPPGTELSTAVLADFVGQPKSSMASCLSLPRDHGALKSRKHPAGYMMWSLGDSTPAPKPDDYDKTLESKQVVVPAVSPSYAPNPPRKDNVTQVQRPEPQPDPDPNRALFGLYSDNTFCVQRDQDAIWLTASEYNELRDFILNRS